MNNILVMMKYWKANDTRIIEENKRIDRVRGRKNLIIAEITFFMGFSIGRKNFQDPSLIWWRNEESMNLQTFF